MSFTTKVIISSQEHLYFINEEEIVLCKSDNCYTYVYLEDKRELLVSKSLAKFSKGLNPKKFIRVNQSYLINIDFIKSIDRKNKNVEMVNERRLPFTIKIKELLSLIGCCQVED